MSGARKTALVTPVAAPLDMNTPWAPAPRVWTTRSGIRSWSKCIGARPRGLRAAAGGVGHAWVAADVRRSPSPILATVVAFGRVVVPLCCAVRRLRGHRWVSGRARALVKLVAADAPLGRRPALTRALTMYLALGKTAAPVALVRGAGGPSRPRGCADGGAQWPHQPEWATCRVVPRVPYFTDASRETATPAQFSGPGARCLVDDRLRDTTPK